MKPKNDKKSKANASPSKVLNFYINGQPFSIKNPDPRVLLVDFLRSPDVGLTGTKKVCAQGGCGACTVMLSAFDASKKEVEHRSVNSCMRPICSLDGMQVTTTEGIGSVNSKLDPVQYQIAINNGSQCGYCTPGWVMNMHAFLAANHGKKLSQKEIEDNFDGNICRCTGFRPILKAMKQFAADKDPEEAGEDNMTCIVADPDNLPTVKTEIGVDFPGALKRPPQAVAFEKNGFSWSRPLTLNDLKRILAKGFGPNDLKLVVGNTSVGIYNQFPLDDADYYYPKHYVDIDHIPELHAWEVSDKGITIGAATTYTTLLNKLKGLSQTLDKHQLGTVENLMYMAHRTAGAIVRNAASLAGNTMLVVHHIKKGSPFPSDLFTALAGLGAKVRVLSSEWKKPQTFDLLEFAAKYHGDKALNRHAVILSYEVPFTGEKNYGRCYKVALRHENSHSIVNAALHFSMKKEKIASASVVFGGIAPVAFHAKKVEETLSGKNLNNQTLNAAMKALKSEIEKVMAANKKRLSNVPNEGFTDDYRLHLAESFLYKHFVYVLGALNKKSVPSNIATAGERKPRPVTKGKQYFESYPEEYPVNQPIIKLSAFLQATGEAKYIHDTFLPPRGLVSAWVTSAKASANISYQIPGKKGNKEVSVSQLKQHLAEKFPGFRDIVDWEDVPMPNEIFQGPGKDDPIFVVNKVTTYGQSIALVLAEEEALAYEIAYYVSRKCIKYDQVEDVVISIEEALAKGQLFKDCPGTTSVSHIWKITREGAILDWMQDPLELDQKAIKMTTTVIDGEECLLIQGWQKSGAQIHYYMETQSGIVEPGEDKDIVVYPSSQSPDSVQSMVKNVLGLQANNVAVRVKRLGGAYGGKTTRSPFIAAPIAVAAWKHKRPVKLAMRREVDTGLVGHRHPTLGNYQIAVSTGKNNPAEAGKIKGLNMNWWFNGGNTYDCSFTVMDCLQLRSSNAYFVPNYQSSGDVCQTNLSSNTAFRAFGMIQGLLGVEDSIEAAAHHLGMQAEDLRANNLYTIGQTTPFGQPLDNLYIKEVWEYTRNTVDFDERLQAITDFNENNKWTKKGICMIPVLYGAGYNAVFLEQGGALVEVYDQDGTIVVRTGGVEMGQGINTKITQVGAEALNVPIGLIRVGETDVQVVPNPIGTGASTGSALNAGAVRMACSDLRKRLEAYCMELLKNNGVEWCRSHKVNFWDYDNGWQAEVDGKMLWQNIVKMAYFDRINLTGQARYRQTGGSGVDSSLSFHDDACTEGVNYFVGYTYNAACTEVEIDVLTGEFKIIQSDIIYDNGKSLNPAIDVGQIEGGFVQGLGYLLTEELVYEEEGENKGRLNTLNTWRYKPPATSTIPFNMNVHLFPRDTVNVEADPNLLLGAKEVGEPPVALAATAFFAIKRAILSARKDTGEDGWFRFDAPATVQRIRESCLVDAKKMKI